VESVVVRHAVLLAVFLSSSVPSVVQVQDDLRVVPGERIGPWKLDTTFAAFVTAYGPPRRDVPQEPPLNPDHSQHQWAGAFWGVVVTDRTSKVMRIATFNPAYKLSNGLHVESAERDVTGLMGNPSLTVALPAKKRLLLYDAVGVGFSINDDPAEILDVYAVSVFRPGTAKTLLASP
jgi:hypothetical protein